MHMNPNTCVFLYSKCGLINAHLANPQPLRNSLSWHNKGVDSTSLVSTCSMAGLLIIMVGLVLVAAVNSQSYPQFEFTEYILTNNSFIFRGDISEGQNDSLHCVTNNSDCCNNGQGNWYDVTGGEVQQGPDGDSNLYVTIGDGVVYLNHRRGGQSGMWRCDIPDSNGVQQSIYIYLGTRIRGI